MSDEQRCPVMYVSYGPSEARDKPGPRSISMSLAERAWTVYRQKWGSGQTLERMIERGGFHAGELDKFIPGWRDEEYELTRLRAENATLRARAEEAERERDARPAITREDAHAYMWKRGIGPSARKVEKALTDHAEEARHVHGCPQCYERVPCAENCSIDVDDDGYPFGAYSTCDACARAHAEGNALLSQSGIDPTVVSDTLREAMVRAREASAAVIDPRRSTPEDYAAFDAHEDKLRAEGRREMLWLMALGAACHVEQTEARVPHTWGTQRMLFREHADAVEMVARHALRVLTDLGDERARELLR